MNSASQQPAGPHADEAGSAECALFGAEDFQVLLDDLVTDSAPRMFAVVQELGEREDAWVAAWGLAFEDRAEVVGVHGRTRMSLRSPEAALRYFSPDKATRPRLIWARPVSQDQ
ncbi:MULTISPECIES: hypothetical protein [unclassified Streptomyces]|uniref:hypothetical protein n=1 Tax=Streptomyces sp. NPDC127532 TaxID=3345399 RepID=UPI0036387818